MAKVIRREVRKRGFFGWVFLLIFLGFNVLMLFFAISFFRHVSSGPVADPASEEVVRAAAGTIGGGMLLFVWALGAVITGLLALLTRGGKTVVTEEVR